MIVRPCRRMQTAAVREGKEITTKTQGDAWLGRPSTRTSPETSDNNEDAFHVNRYHLERELHHSRAGLCRHHHLKIEEEQNAKPPAVVGPGYDWRVGSSGTVVRSVGSDFYDEFRWNHSQPKHLPIEGRGVSGWRAGAGRPADGGQPSRWHIRLSGDRPFGQDTAFDRSGPVPAVYRVGWDHHRSGCGRRLRACNPR